MFGPHKHPKMRRPSTPSSCPPISKARLSHTNHTIHRFRMAASQGSKNLYLQPDQTPPGPLLVVKVVQASLLPSWDAWSTMHVACSDGIHCIR